VANPTIFGIDIFVLVFFIIVLLFTVLAARGTYTIMRRLLDLRVGKRNSKLVSNLVQYLVVSLGLGYGVLEVLRLDLTALAASLGIVGIAVAFSSQQLIQNFVAGLMIAVDRRVQLEDWVEISAEPNNRPSRVVDITLTRTMLRDVSGRMMIVPNSLLITNRVVNYSQSGFVEVVLPFPLPLGVDRSKVIDIITKVLEEHEKVLPNVKGAELQATNRELNIPRLRRYLNDRNNLDQFMPRVMVQDVTGLRVNLSARFWIREIQLREVIISEVLSAILDGLEREGIRIP
jgi:small-conductance mechanosensitive channel